MLLKFITKNYKSFVEEMTFSMSPAPKQKGLDYSILSMKAGSTTYKGLSTAVIYGPNASGKKILSWFSNKFIVVYRSDDMRLVRKFADPKANTVYVETTLTDVAREFGITGNALGYKSTGTDDTDETVLCTILGNRLLPAEMFESYGTIRFINELPDPTGYEKYMNRRSCVLSKESP